MIRALALVLFVAWLAAPAVSHAAAPAADVERALADLAGADADRRDAAVAVLGGTGDPKWLAFLSALRDGNVYARKVGGKVEILVGGAKSTKGDQDLIEIKAPYDGAARGVVPVAGLGGERDRWVRHALGEARALTQLASTDAGVRTAAAHALGALHSLSATAPLARLAGDASASAGERAAAAAAIKKIERWTILTTAVETAFQGASLASILLLMALGLAIVFGIMGVINMAHGELMALGAYATFVVQNVFRERWPQYFDAYFLVALPVSFLVAALVGVVLERGVIRRLYGRPLETLLLTWGASLIIQQGLRLWFGAANVDVASPSWLSGGVAVMAGLTLPWNRVFIMAL